MTPRRATVRVERSTALMRRHERGRIRSFEMQSAAPWQRSSHARKSASRSCGVHPVGAASLIPTSPRNSTVCAVPVHGCLHLKSAATALDERTVLINREWTEQSRFAGRRLVDIDPAEPFAANTLALGGALIHAAEFPATRAILAGNGHTVRPVPASELAKAEGGVTCCSLIVMVP